MKNLILALAVLAVLASSAKAAGTVMQVAYSSYTVGGIAVSSFTGTSITGGANQGWRQVCLQDYDTSNPVFCGDTVNVSTSAKVSLGNLGVYIPAAAAGPAPAAPTCFILVEGMNFFCRSGSASSSSTLIISKAK